MKINKDPWQQEFIDAKGDKILCTGRQVGKTEICAEDGGSWACNNKKAVVLMIAPTERQAYNLFSKTLEWLMENNRSFIKMGRDRPTKSKIVLKNGTKIFCLPTGISGMGIRGLTVSRLYVDEASRVPEEVWAAVTPMLLTTGGDTILLSTPFGAQGEFHRCWINKDSAYDSFKRFSVNSEEVIQNREISDTWTLKQREKGLLIIKRAKSRLSNLLFAQEYMGEFIEDLFRYFSEELIKDVCLLKRPETIKKQQIYFMGCDIARMGEDEGTYEILIKEKMRLFNQVESIITTKQLTTQTEDRILVLNELYDFRQIGIDAGSGSLGVGIFDHLLRTKVRRKIVAINNIARELDRWGKSKTKILKEDLYDNLRAMMERGEIRLLDDDEIIESLRSIQYEYVAKSGQPTKMRIYGNYSHIVEGLIRAAWLAKGKSLNPWIRSIKI